MSRRVEIRTREPDFSPSIPTVTLYYLEWGPGERLPISVGGNRGRNHGECSKKHEMGQIWKTMTNRFHETGHWVHLKRQRSEKETDAFALGRPGEQLLPERGSRRKVQAGGRTGQWRTNDSVSALAELPLKFQLRFEISWTFFLCPLLQLLSSSNSSWIPATRPH